MTFLFLLITRAFHIFDYNFERCCFEKKNKQIAAHFLLTHSFQGQLIETKNVVKEAFPAQGEHIPYTGPETILFFVYSSKLEDEDLFTLPSPAPKQGLTHSRPSTNLSNK